MPQAKKWTMGKRKLSKNLWEVFEDGVSAGTISEDPQTLGKYRFVDRFGKIGRRPYETRKDALVALRARLRKAKELGTKNWQALQSQIPDATG